MSGIYIHIPFCKRKCNYCSFYSSTTIKNLSEMVSCICKELVLQKGYLSDKVETIYFGGGTPSLLDTADIKQIIETIKNNYKLIHNPEITIECNPIDLSLSKIQNLKNIGFNRLSVGIQSFNDKYLRILGRIDNSKDIEKAINNIRFCHFENFNLDIIFSIFGQTKDDLLDDLQKIIKIKPPHISAYCLNIEPKTIFDFLVKNGKVKPLDENTSADYFLLVNDILTQQGYRHYEISNYCLPGFEAKHNSIYWDTKKQYLGIGPGAHSYNITSRQWNVESNILYIKSVQENKIPFTIENLTKEQKLYEYFFTSLRTNKGLNMSLIENVFQYKINTNILHSLTDNELAIIKNNVLILTPKGMLLLNKIILLLL